MKLRKDVEWLSAFLANTTKMLPNFVISVRVSLRKNKAENGNLLILMVGVRGFEPPTPSSRTRCATSLRYTPTNWCWRAYTVMMAFPQVFFIKKPVNNCSQFMQPAYN